MAENADDEQAAAAKKVEALHRKVEALADEMASREDPQAIGKAGDLYLSVARQVSDNAGLAKRHAAKVDACVSKAGGIDE